MKISVYNHRGPRFTAKKMRESAKFTEDIGNLKELSFQDYYETIKNIPYIDDPQILYRAELVARPKYLLYGQSLDCKKKSILMGAYCNAQLPKLKFKFIGSSERSDRLLHHVFPIVKLNNQWVVADATFKRYFLGEGKPFLTKYEIL
jgi:hypothetical protein